ncbi:2OG-Fe dioxygenase family protein [Halomonas sp. ISL-60]|uniref:2OG-Fe dioxygenase family protein n=1 Tax=Halomonas sp. ISL-56 TaxID=2819149 RepID=UPI001BEBA2C7|nr:2OG-Fe dioxygenase family protein [Halomonas sp. ISL-56]MBT2772134.1 2OG-Fe dioxygenase family protein [Halomonas sp. ISL-60]MBT2803745.1 2OG-Fe dioxygenase family protein [Halomonas sp. ISL-56]
MQNISSPTTPQPQAHMYDRVHSEVIDLCRNIARNDFVLLPAKHVRSLITLDDESLLEDWEDFQNSWNRLEQDQHMKDGGKYRFRRHGVYSAEPSSSVKPEPRQPHYQSLDYNTLNGGIARDFAPIEPAIANCKILMAALELCRRTFSSIAPFYGWHIEVHQFRIIATDNQALPTPEGAHRDGVSFVFMMLVNRKNVISGETSIYNRERKELARHTLTTPFDAAIVNDERTLHGVTPITAEDSNEHGYRDVLVITFNKH